jgi:tetratricopeptide (TPR) repeat protein
MEEIELDYESFRRMTNDSGDPEMAINRGRFAEKNNDLEGAIDDYSNAIQYDPRKTDAYKYRGNCYRLLDKYDLAIQDYLKMIELNPDDAAGYRLLEFAYILNGNLDEAIETCEKTLSFNPNDLSAHFDKGFAKFKKKDYEGALIHFSKAIEIEPKYKDSYSLRFQCRLNLGDFQASIEDMNNLIKLDPNNPKWYYNKAIAYGVGLKDKNLGIENMRIAAKLGLHEAVEFLRKNNILL